MTALFDATALFEIVGGAGNGEKVE